MVGSEVPISTVGIKVLVVGTKVLGTTEVGDVDGFIVGLLVDTGIELDVRVGIKVGTLEGILCTLTVEVGLFDGTLVDFTVGVNEGLNVEELEGRFVG